jgi:hypothetical protein
VAKNFEKGEGGFDFIFRCVFETIFKIKVSRVSYSFFLHKLYVLRRFSYLICMDVVAYHILFDMYGLFLVR